MAYIRRRLGKYLVMVRRVGFTPVTKTFTTLRSARQFAKEVEAGMYGMLEAGAAGEEPDE